MEPNCSLRKTASKFGTEHKWRSGMRSLHRIDPRREFLFIVFGLLIVSQMVVTSCGSPDASPNRTANEAPSNPTANAQTSPTPDLATVNRVDQMAVGTAANFRAPNGKVFKVVLRAEEPEFPAQPDNETNTAAHAPSNHVCDGDAFDGSDRKASKTKPSDAVVENFDDLSTFINTLKSDKDMGQDHQPEISTGPASIRVSEERRNVQIGRAWLYTFSRESDEDFHVIIGTTDDKETAKFFNVEISGLPASSSSAFGELNDARTTFKDFFGLTQCSGGYTADLLDNPQEVKITGSPFFDKLHFDGHAPIGPTYARSSSYWEIHPVTKIVFK